jgi:hypothetical protein
MMMLPTGTSPVLLLLLLLLLYPFILSKTISSRLGWTQTEPAKL